MSDEIISGITTKQAMDHLKQVIQTDEDYAWGWHCNLAMAMCDNGVPRTKANDTAANVMQQFFGTDTRTNKFWKVIAK